jgi:hypothetical protein
VSGEKVVRKYLYTRLQQNGTSEGVLPWYVQFSAYLIILTSPCIGFDVGRVNLDIRTAEFRNLVKTCCFVDAS